MGVISVQSHVSFGHVGNSAAVYPMQRLGVEVWPVHTTLLAHHPGHGGVHGAMVAPETVGAVLGGLDRLGAFGKCTALLSGYLGSAETGAVLLDAWQTIKAASPGAIYCCAAVMGDREEGLYVDAALPAFFRDSALQLADVVVVNAFEAGLLGGADVVDLDTARECATAIRALGAGTVIITSVPHTESGSNHIGNLLVERAGTWLAHAPRLPVPAKGAGDFMAAAWLARYLAENDSAAALRFAAGAVQSVIEQSGEQPLQELPVIAADDQWQGASGSVHLRKID